MEPPWVKPLRSRIACRLTQVLSEKKTGNLREASLTLSEDFIFASFMGHRHGRGKCRIVGLCVIFNGLRYSVPEVCFLESSL